MILAFETEELRTLCEDDDAARSHLGDDVAHALRIRLADLRASDSIHDLLVGNPTPTGEGGSLLEVDLVDGVGMTFAPNHSHPRIADAGTTNWALIRRIRLISIGGRL